MAQLGEGSLTTPRHGGAPPSTPILVATQLADLAANGLPIDNEVIAAAILAEAADLDALDAATVEARLGPGVLALLRDIARVRALPSRVEILDAQAASELRELCLSFYDVRAVAVEIVSRAVAMASSDRLPVWARQIAALEGLQIYAPLGHALGLGTLSSALEDRCFQALFPQTYDETAAWLRQERLINADVLQRCSRQLQAALDADEELRRCSDHVQVHWYVCVPC